MCLLVTAVSMKTGYKSYKPETDKLVQPNLALFLTKQLKKLEH